MWRSLLFAHHSSLLCFRCQKKACAGMRLRNVESAVGHLFPSFPTLHAVLMLRDRGTETAPSLHPASPGPRFVRRMTRTAKFTTSSPSQKLLSTRSPSSIKHRCVTAYTLHKMQADGGTGLMLQYSSTHCNVQGNVQNTLPQEWKLNPTNRQTKIN